MESAVTTTYCYDSRGNVLQKRQTQGSQIDTISYSYSLAGRLVSTLTPSGTSVQYVRDVLGRISGVTVLPSGVTGAGAGNVVSNITYLPFGPVTSYTLGNGQTITRTYDANYAVTDVVSPVLNLHFVRDAMGNVAALGNSRGASPAIETYSYDPLYRLTSVSDSSDTAIEAYTYSRTGDRLSKTGSGLATGAYGYQANTHWLTSIGNGARTYDANGNTIGSANSGETYGYGYNGRNRLTVLQRNGQTVATYAYNAAGQRIAKTASLPQSVAERFTYDEGSQLTGEYGSTNRDYIWLGDIPVALVDTSGIASTINYVHADGLNTPRIVTDALGAILWGWGLQGNPFGEQSPTTPTGYVFNLRFPGQYYDAESGLANWGFRSYAASVGRSVQSDPTGLLGGQWSTYAYVDSRPLTRIDPLGLRALTPGEIAMAIPIFNGTVDLSKVDIKSGGGLDPRTWGPIATGNAVSLENTIRFPASGYLADFSNGSLSDQAWLVHELTHVYQNQNDPNYSWTKAADEGTRSDTYNYNLNEHGCFSGYRYERQAAIVADYYVATQRVWSRDLVKYEALLNPLGLGISRRASPNVLFLGDP